MLWQEPYTCNKCTSSSTHTLEFMFFCPTYYEFQPRNKTQWNVCKSWYMYIKHCTWRIDGMGILTIWTSVRFRSLQDLFLKVTLLTSKSPSSTSHLSYVTALYVTGQARWPDNHTPIPSRRRSSLSSSVAQAARNTQLHLTPSILWLHRSPSLAFNISLIANEVLILSASKWAAVRYPWQPLQEKSPMSFHILFFVSSFSCNKGPGSPENSFLS